MRGSRYPPAPTKKSSIRTGYWIFCFADTFSGLGGMTAASGRSREALLGLRPAGCACRPRHDAAAGIRAPGSFLFCAAREIHEKCANKNHRPGGWWFGDREKTGFTLKRAGRRRGQRARACWIFAKSSNVRASGRMRASNPAASMAAVTASLGIPRPLAMALAAVLRR